jgi:hypothetical protein
MTPDIVYVEWDDSAGTPGWVRNEDLDQACYVAKCCTVGFLVTETETQITLALNASQDGKSSHFGDCITIPKCAVTRRVLARSTL